MHHERTCADGLTLPVACGRGLKSKKPSKIQELQHLVETVTDGAGDGGKGAAEGGAGGAGSAAGEVVGYKLTVDLPENITGMDDLDVEVSSYKVCLGLGV